MSLLGGLLGVAAAPFTGGASLVPALVGAGVGALKHQFVDKPAEEASRKQAAETMRFSPWTGMQAAPIRRAPGLFASALQGGAIGSSMGDLWKKVPMGGGGAGLSAGASSGKALGRGPEVMTPNF